MHDVASKLLQVIRQDSFYVYELYIRECREEIFTQSRKTGWEVTSLKSYALVGENIRTVHTELLCEGVG